MEESCDILLAGGRVIDPARGVDGVLDVAVKGGRIAAVGPDLPRRGAREVVDVKSESTGELERLADTLGQAAQQARAAAALRRRMRASNLVGRLADRLFESLTPVHEPFLRGPESDEPEDEGKMH